MRAMNSLSFQSTFSIVSKPFFDMFGFFGGVGGVFGCFFFDIVGEKVVSDWCPFDDVAVSEDVLYQLSFTYGSTLYNGF